MKDYSSVFKSLKICASTLLCLKRTKFNSSVANEKLMINIYFVYFLYIFYVCIFTAQIDFFFLVLFNILNFNVSNY